LRSTGLFDMETNCHRRGHRRWQM